jgi:hypothetical protein
MIRSRYDAYLFVSSGIARVRSGASDASRPGRKLKSRLADETTTDGEAVNAALNSA